MKQTCPICGASNPSEARTCAICGARLSGRSAAASPIRETADSPAFYDSAAGEDDLLVSRVTESRWLTVLLLLVGLAVAVGLLWAATRPGDDENSVATEVQVERPTLTLTAVHSPTASPQGGANATATPVSSAGNTGGNAPLIGPPVTAASNPGATATLPPVVARTSIPLPTITPTITPTPTQGPCQFTVQDGDTLYQFALNCGYNDLSAVNIIVEFNNLSCDSCISIGQVIQVPRPTTVPTEAPESGAAGEAAAPGVEVAMVTDSGAEGGVNGEGEPISADDLIATRVVQAEPTLDPNLMYHTVSTGQTLYEVLATYNIDVKLLSEINPEVDFPQCDFGMQFGGPNCAVFLYEGQRLRVPAPTATPTLPPTPTGNETATPTATPTINVPAPFSPQPNTRFAASDVVTLRWSTTGTLGRDEVYLIQVRNADSNAVYSAFTCDLAFDLPSEWRPRTDREQTYEWTVSVADVTPDLPPVSTIYTVRSLGLSLCDLSFTMPASWQAASDAGSVTSISLTDIRYSTSARQFMWQGRRN